MTQSTENKISIEYKKLLENTYQSISKDEKSLIRTALNVAIDAHKDQYRKSGEPYIFHPIAVANIVAHKIGLGATSIAAALLHDVVEDSDDYSLEDIDRIFGSKIKVIIEGLTKLSVIKNKKSSVQSENIRKLLLTISDDIRVVLIKLADRLHNMQTMESMPRYKQERIASETLFIYAPLAHRLGLYNIKTELENLGLKYTQPKVYNDIERQIAESKDAQNEYITNFTNKIETLIEPSGLKFDIKSRVKSIYSIYNKIQNKGVSIDGIYDLFAIRIIYDSDIENEKINAWRIYSLITDKFRPNPTRLRDWITTPRATGYEALHVTVLGEKSKWIEVQIRSERMNEIAEKGYAAHYKYKNESSESSAMEKWIDELKESLSNDEKSASAFVENMKMDLYSKEIFVFTPEGEIKSLPKKSTPVDFAFSVHTEVGYHCHGAKVNGKFVPINTILKSGDSISIITSDKQKPKVSWLEFVKTSKAKSKIKSSLKEEKNKIAENGKELLSKKLRQLKSSLSEDITNSLVVYFKVKTSQEVFYKVGTGDISMKEIKNFLDEKNSVIYSFYKKIKNSVLPDKKIDKSKVCDSCILTFGDDEQRLDYTLANCCNPLKGDNVFGFVTINKGITVHKKDCSNAVSLNANYSYRIIDANWIDENEVKSEVTIKLKGIDSVGIINKITSVINSFNIHILSLNISAKNNIFESSVTLEIENAKQLTNLINKLKSIDGVKKVVR